MAADNNAIVRLNVQVLIIMVASDSHVGLVVETPTYVKPRSTVS